MLWSDRNNARTPAGEAIGESSASYYGSKTYIADGQCGASTAGAWRTDARQPLRPSLLDVSIVRLFILTLSAASVLVAIAGSSVGAQASTPADARHGYAARAVLETQAARAEDVAASATTEPALRESKRAEAYMLRQRLQAGDFLVGDRVVVTVMGEPT